MSEETTNTKRERKRGLDRAYYEKNKDQILASRRRVYAEGREEYTPRPTSGRTALHEKHGVPWDPPAYGTKRRSRNQQLLTSFGMTVEDYEGMIWLQDGRCLMCHESFDEMGHKYDPAVDHDHGCCPTPGGASKLRTCGKCVRGVICGPCNRRLGFYERFKGDCERYLTNVS